MIKKLTSITTAVLAAAVMCSCAGSNGGEAPNTENDKLQVYTSFYAMYDFARQIGADEADVYLLCPVGAEPHDFEPTASDMAKMTDCDIFIFNGMGMEPWADSVVPMLENEGVITLEASSAAVSITENNDPHVWLNPSNAYEQMSMIAKAYSDADPDNAQYYAQRLNECKEKTDKLIKDYSAAAEGFKTKNIITSHEAYMNLCQAFGLNQTAINGTDNSEDSSPARMAQIENFIKENNIRYIFTEPLGTSSVAEAIASDTDCTLLTLDPFEGNNENKDYFTIMYENLDALKKALS